MAAIGIASTSVLASPRAPETTSTTHPLPSRDYLDQRDRALKLTQLAKAVQDTCAGNLPLSLDSRQRLAHLGLKASKRIGERIGLLDQANAALVVEDVPQYINSDAAEENRDKLPARLFTSADCLMADVSWDFCALWSTQILDPDVEKSWRSWIPSEVIALANSTPRAERDGILFRLYGRVSDVRSKIYDIVKATRFSPDRVIELTHYGYNHGWAENIVRERIGNARNIVEDALFMLFAELFTADTQVESEWRTDELEERAIVRLLEHACGIATTDLRPTAFACSLIATCPSRQAYLNGETPIPDLTQYFWLRYVDSGVMPAHIWASAGPAPRSSMDIPQLPARDGMLANDLNDTIVDATGSGLNFVLAAYSNGRSCTGTHVGLILRGSLLNGIKHAIRSGDIQQLVAQIMGQMVHLWGPRYDTASLLGSLTPVENPDTSSYVVDTNWPPHIDRDPGIYHGYLNVLHDYSATATHREESGQEAYYKLLDATESQADKCEVEKCAKECVYWLAAAAESGHDLLAWGAVSDGSIGTIISPMTSPSNTRLHSIRQSYSQMK